MLEVPDAVTVSFVPPRTHFHNSTKEKKTNGKAKGARTKNRLNHLRVTPMSLSCWAYPIPVVFFTTVLNTTHDKTLHNLCLIALAEETICEKKRSRNGVSSTAHTFHASCVLYCEQRKTNDYGGDADDKEWRRCVCVISELELVHMANNNLVTWQ